MSETLGTAVLTLITDDTKLKAGIAGAKVSTESLLVTFTKANLGALAIAEGAKAAFTLVKDLVVAVTKEAADYGDKIRDAGIQTGLTTETLSGLKLMAEQNGASFEDLNTGLRFLAKNFIGATDGGKDQIKAFGALGITTKDLKSANGDLDTIMRTVMDRLREMPDGAAKTAAELALLGRGGSALTEMFSQGSGTMQRYIDLTRILGTDVTPEAAAAADEFNDALNLLDQAVLGASVSTGNELIPAITDFIRVGTAAIVTAKDYGLEMFDMAKGIANVAKAHLGKEGLNDLMAGFLMMLPGGVQAATSVALTYGKLETATAGLTTENKAVAKAWADAAAASAAAEEASKKFRTEVDQVKNSVTGNAEKTSALKVALQELERAGVPTQAIIKSLGDSVQATRDKMVANGQAVDPLIGKYADLTTTSEELEAEVKANKKAFDDMMNSMGSSAAMNSAKAILEDFARFTLRQEVMGAIIAVHNAHQDWLKSAGFDSESMKSIKAALDEATLTMKIHEDAIRATGDAHEEISAEMAAELTGLTTAEIVEIRKRETERAASETKQKESAASIKRAWETAMGNITSDMSKAFADILFHGGNFKNSMIDIAKSAAGGMMSAFFAGLLNPLTGALGELGGRLADLLSGKGGGVGDLLGGLFGGGGSGGGGGVGTGAKGLISGAGSTIAGLVGSWGGTSTATLSGGLTGTTTTAGSGLLGGLHSATNFLMSNPWTIAVGAGIAGITAWIKSQAHHEANQIVKDIENPFWKAWGEILPSDQPSVLSALSPENAFQIASNLAVMNDNYLGLVEQFRKGGSDEELVSKQSLANTQPHVQRMLDALKIAIRRSAPEPPPIVDPGGGSDVTPPDPPTDLVDPVSPGGGGSGGGSGGMDDWMRTMFGGAPSFHNGGISDREQLAVVDRNEMMIPEKVWSQMTGNIDFGGVTIVAAPGDSPEDLMGKLIDWVRNNRGRFGSDLREALAGA